MYICFSHNIFLFILLSLLAVLWTQQGVEEELCEASISSYIEEKGFSYPLEIGKILVLFICIFIYISAENEGVKYAWRMKISRVLNWALSDHWGSGS